MRGKKGKDFRTEINFVRGKMKKRKVPLIEGMEVDEFIRRNADETHLLQEGHYELLDERHGTGKAPRGGPQASLTSDQRLRRP